MKQQKRQLIDKSPSGKFFVVEKSDSSVDFSLFYTLIANAKNILIVTSKPHTADPVCAALALGKILKSQDKKVTTVVESGSNNPFYWLPGAEILEKSLESSEDFIIHVQSENVELERIKYSLDEKGISLYLTPKNGQFNPKDVQFGKNHDEFDLILTIGIEKLEELGDLWKQNTSLFASSTVLPILPSSKVANFGQSPQTVAGAGTNCEVVYEILRSNQPTKQQINEDLATILLSGIASSTESFLDTSTRPKSLSIASELIDKGADHTFAVNKLFKSKSLQTLQIWGKILSSLELDRIHKLAWASISQSDLLTIGASEIEISGIIDTLLRHLEGSEIAILFIESAKDVQIQVRASDKSHLFDSLAKSDEYETEMVPHGANITLRGVTLPEIQMAFMRDVVAFQKNRYNLPENLPITRSTLTPLPFETKKTKKKPKNKKKTGWVEKDLPFGLES